VGQALRENVRHNAILAHVAETEFVIADSFDMPDPSPLVERIRSAIAMTPSRVTASIGVVSTPLRPLASRAPHEVLDEIMSIATVAMHEARRAGGNQARYVRHPDLSVEGPGTDITP
jgi:GGDEF domain-containing protein